MTILSSSWDIPNHLVLASDVFPDATIVRRGYETNEADVVSSRKNATLFCYHFGDHLGDHLGVILEPILREITQSGVSFNQNIDPGDPQDGEVHILNFVGHATVLESVQ